jgi:hypothetical protein
MEKLCTNKNHSYKHNGQINKQNIDNSECFGVKYVKIYPEMTSQYFFEKIWYIDNSECFGVTFVKIYPEMTS